MATPTNPITMIPVHSTNILSAGFDPTTGTLRVEFVNGGIYEHYQVPEAIWAGLRSSFSAGKYYAQHLKGGFNYQKVSE